MPRLESLKLTKKLVILKKLDAIAIHVSKCPFQCLLFNTKIEIL